MSESVIADEVIFPVLEPGGNLPKGVIFINEPKELAPLRNGDVDLAIWRLPWRQELIDACAKLDLFSIWDPSFKKILGAPWPFNYYVDSAQPERIVETPLPADFYTTHLQNPLLRLVEASSTSPLINRTFFEIARFTLLPAQDQFQYSFSRLQAYISGFSDTLHYDGGLLLRATIGFKNGGSWVVTRKDGEAPEPSKYCNKQAETLRSENSIYQIATADVAFFGPNFIHSGVTLLRPEDSRLMGVLLVADRPLFG